MYKSNTCFYLLKLLIDSGGGGGGGVMVVVLLIVVPMYLLLYLSLKIEVQICLVRVRGNYGNVIDTYKIYHSHGRSGQG